MFFIKISAWIYFCITLILCNVLESYSETLDIPLETEIEVKDPIVVISTTLPVINEVDEIPENDPEKDFTKNDPIETVAVETVKAESMDNHIKDTSDYQSDAANDELSTVTKEVVEKQTSIEIQPSVPTEANTLAESKDSVDEKPTTLKMNEVIEVTEPSHKSTEPVDDDSKEKTHAEAGVDETQVATIASTSLLKCYSCSSERTRNCVAHPTKEVGCPIRQGETHNGCFALVKEHSNVTTRGCIADLTDEGLGYCKNKNNKQCMLCYEPGCNKLKIAFNGGLANLQSESMLIALGVVIVAFINC